MKIKITLIAVLCIWVFSAALCRKEGPNCHKNMYFENNSSSSVIFAVLYSNDGLSIADGPVVSAFSTHTENGHNCREGDFTYDSATTREFFVIDPDSFNAKGVYYPKDSFKFKNKVLKHFRPTRDYMNSTNYTLTYP